MTACPLCGGPSRPRLTTTDVNRRIGDEQFRYRECERCGTWFLENEPADLSPYYPATYYDLAATEEVSPTERAKLRIVQRHKPAGRLVEVGTGGGTFAAAARAAGYDVTGIEMDEQACRHLREGVGVQAIQSDNPAEALRGIEPADAIVMWHVLEHVHEPLGVVEAAAAALAPGGILVIATPNPKALQLRVLGSRWTHIDAPRHLFLMPETLLTDAARKAGLERAELVTADRTALDWNAFGWQRALRHRAPGLAEKLGSAFAIVLAPVELSAMRGAAYTVVYRRS
jgi:2-polyprenyl-3-methyl-5-hydroxy-6-metoxy-1,4-benzoquinol methylase